MQSACVTIASAQVVIELPSPQTDVLPGVTWGCVESFPTPAYWAYQVLARRIGARTVRYRLGRSLAEEVAACLLGGHGIPAAVGLEAFHHLKRKGAFTAEPPSQEQLHDWLLEPLRVHERTVRYRFAAQKARYLSGALARLMHDAPPVSTGRCLRDWLTSIPGIGHKTASWIARNWLDADDVAILDIHILRAGVLAGFLDSSLTVEQHYLELEAQFLTFSRALGVRASELDAVIWLEMAQSRRTVEMILQALPESRFKQKHARSREREESRDSHPTQLSLTG